MKEFRFALDTVLNYKGQVLDNLKNEHAQILSRIAIREKAIEDLEVQSDTNAANFDMRKAQGMMISEIRACESYLSSLHHKIEVFNQELQVLKRQERAKRAELIEAKKSTASIEKLRDKKQAQHKKEEQKKEELFIEEFVSNSRFSANK